MNNYRVRGIDPTFSSALKGTLTIPSSKSQTLRAILFGMLGQGKTFVRNYLHSPDTFAMIEACRKLNANIHVHPDRLEIDGCGIKESKSAVTIDVGNSGLVLRLIGALAGLYNHPIILTGDYSICNNRPVQPLLDGLSQLGVSAVSLKNNGLAPFSVLGPIIKGKTIISGEDSQPVSGLIIAAAFAKRPIEIEVKNPGEKSWVLLTLDWLDRLGIPYEREGFSNFHLQGSSKFNGFDYTVPGDLSSVAFPLVASIITQSSITLNNVDMNDQQGDKKLISILQQMGATIQEESKKLQIHTNQKAISSSLQGSILDINDYIDAIAILAVVGCYAEGETVLMNAANARNKECDRIKCLTKELKKMGASIEERPDGLIIRQSKLKGALVNSHDDHRLAMALTVAALGASGETVITGVDCIKKTYPNFRKDLNQLGADIQEIPCI